MTVMDHARPAAPLGSPLALLRRWADRRRRRRIDRLAFRRMLSLDDAMLRDIGVTRADVEWAARLPLHRDAAAELRRVSAHALR